MPFGEHCYLQEKIDASTIRLCKLDMDYEE
jgi:hypothetical protein